MTLILAMNIIVCCCENKPRNLYFKKSKHLVSKKISFYLGKLVRSFRINTAYTM